MVMSRIFLLVLVICLAGLVLAGSSRAAGQAATGDYPPTPEKEKAVERQASGYDRVHLPVSTNSVAPAAVYTSDHFGYQLNDSVALNWLDARSTGTKITFTDPDDSYTGLIPIGFPFKFYEKTYTHLSVSTNGLVAFESGSDAFSNQILPQDTLPNNLIAAFWDDLDLGAGAVYYRLFNTSPRAFVIEWHEVVRYGGSDKLTFEAILFENGDILLQYLHLSGELDSATVGIEDSDGIDGLMYLYNASGLSSGKAIRFNRPPAGARVKALPVYQSGFAIQRQASFRVVVRNIGELGPDTYNLAANSSNPGWAVSFLSTNGVTLLGDSNQDGKVDTGTVSQGGEAEILLKVSTTGSAQVGDYTEITVVATSAQNQGKSASTRIQVAIPAPFVQAFADSDSGMFVNMIWRQSRTAFRVSNFFTGNTLSLNMRPDGRYVYAWERNGSTLVGNQKAYFSDLEYLMLGRFGNVVRSLDLLTNNAALANPDLIVNARYPALASTQDGKTVVLWAQYQLNLTTTKSNANLFYGILDELGNVTSGLVNLTQNDQWRGPGDYNIPNYNNPCITSIGGNRLVFAWIEGRQQTIGEVSSINYAIYTTSGSQIKGPTPVAQSVPGNTLFIDPNLATLNGERALLTYSIFNEVTKSYAVMYSILDKNGNIIRNPAPIPGSSGWRASAVQLNDANILFAWTNPTTERISVAAVDSTGNTLVKGPTDLPLLGSRKPDYVSITTDAFGNAILIWMDSEWKDYLYYALANKNGQIVTPPMIFATGEATNPMIQTSFTGQGVAPFHGFYQVFLSLAIR